MERFPEVALRTSWQDKKLCNLAPNMVKWHSRQLYEDDFANFLIRFKSPDEMKRIKEKDFQNLDLDEGSESFDNIKLTRGGTSRDVDIRGLLAKATHSAARKSESIGHFSRLFNKRLGIEKRRQFRSNRSQSIIAKVHVAYDSKTKLESIDELSNRSENQVKDEFMSRLIKFDEINDIFLMRIFHRAAIISLNIPIQSSSRRKSCEDRASGGKASKEARLASKQQESDESLLYSRFVRKKASKIKNMEKKGEITKQQGNRLREHLISPWYISYSFYPQNIRILSELVRLLCTKRVINNERFFSPSPILMIQRKSLVKETSQKTFQRITTMERVRQRSKRRIANVIPIINDMVQVIDFEALISLASVFVQTDLFMESKQQKKGRLFSFVRGSIFRNSGRLKSIVQVGQIKSLRSFKEISEISFKYVQEFIGPSNIPDNAKLNKDIMFIKFLSSMSTKKQLLDMLKEKEKINEKKEFMSMIIEMVYDLIKSEGFPGATKDDIHAQILKDIKTLYENGYEKIFSDGTEERKYTIIEDLNMIAKGIERIREFQTIDEKRKIEEGRVDSVINSQRSIKIPKALTQRQEVQLFKQGEYKSELFCLLKNKLALLTESNLEDGEDDCTHSEINNGRLLIEPTNRVKASFLASIMRGMRSEVLLSLTRETKVHSFIRPLKKSSKFKVGTGVKRWGSAIKSEIKLPYDEIIKFKKMKGSAIRVRSTSCRIKR